MAQRNKWAERIPWIVALIPCIVGGVKIHELNDRADNQDRKLEVVSGALADIKTATQHDEWTPTQKTHLIEQVLAVAERECKERVE